MSKTKPPQLESAASRWPHRLAWVLVSATFLLIWVGGTVTSYEAGMAVPDWPTTRGHWFYPIQLWIGQGWDLFLEHGHRLLAQAVGIITIALAVLIWRKDPRHWMRWLGVAAIAGVVFQGILGGLRVVGADLTRWMAESDVPGRSLLGLIGNDVMLKRIHGSTAPLFFSLCAVLVMLTSRRWFDPPEPTENRLAQRLRRLAVAVTVGFYLLIVLGTLLRHQYLSGVDFEVWHWLTTASGGLIGNWFQFWLSLKLTMAGLVTIGVVWMVVAVLRNASVQPMLLGRAKLLAGLFAVQLLLAGATWVTNYNWPAWFEKYVWEAGYTVVQEGRLQIVLTTLHSAFGALVLVTSLNLTIWISRLLKLPEKERGTGR